MSLYDYCGGDPLNWCDPDGRCLEAAWSNTLGNTRVQGGLMIGQGALEATGAGALLAAPDPTMLTKAGGVALGLHAVDVASAGWNQLWTGNSTQSLTSQGICSGLQSVGVDPYYANMTGGLFDATMGMTAGRVMLSMPKTTLDARYIIVDTSKEDTITLYRGVNQSNANFAQQSTGVVSANRGWWQFWKPVSTPLEHNIAPGGTIFSPYTSWTTNPAVAENFALRPGGSGVVITVQVPSSRIIISPNIKTVILIQGGGEVSESEVLLQGTVKGSIRLVSPY